MSDSVATAIFEEVRGVVGEVLELSPDQISMESRFGEDLGADSYAQILLVLALEDDLGIEVSEDDAADLATVGQAVELVGRLRSK